MKRILFGLATFVAIAAFTTTAGAAIEASAYLNILGFKVMNTATGLPVTVGIGGDVVLVGSGAGTTTSATLNGLTDLNVGGTVDGLAAFSDGVTTGAPAGVENNFSPRPLGIVPLPYARADSNGTGTIATILPAGPTTGATVGTISDVVVPNTATIDNTGVASTTVASTFVVVRITSPLSITLNFDAELDITLDYALPPSGLKLTGSASFEASIIGTGITTGGSTSGSFSFAPAALNTGLITLTGPGTIGGHPGSVLGPFVTPVLSLAPGTYVFNLTQGTTASISAIPEPTAVLSWGMLATIGAVGEVIRRRRLTA